MKKLLQFEKITFLCMLVLLFSGHISAQEKLIFVTDTTKMRQGPGEDVASDSIIAEQHIIDRFLEDGYDVEIWQYKQLSTVDQSVIDMLNEADLIYLGRVIPTDPNFMPANKPMWNELYAPIITENMWALRNSRLNWFNTVTISMTAGVEDSAIVYAFIENDQLEDEVFEGLEDLFEDLSLADSIPFWYGQWDCINPEEPGNGTVMARLAGGQPCWVRFDYNEEFYPGSVDAPMGERVYFGLGHDQSSAPPQFYSRLTEVSKEIFLREAARLSWHDRGETGVKKVNYGSVASKIYFNPLTQNLVVEMDNLNKVEVLDISGRLIYTALTKSNKLYVDLGFAKSGIYLVRLTDNNNNFSTNKIVK
jgi:hypothetical protein